MQKELKKSAIYLILALVSGVFFREFTKFYAFSLNTTLSITHVHLFVLGTLLYLVLALFCMQTSLNSLKSYKTFNRLYNISLPFMVIMFYVRGIVQVLNVPMSYALNSAIAGISGVSHILMAVSFYFLYKALMKVEKS